MFDFVDFLNSDPELEMIIFNEYTDFEQGLQDAFAQVTPKLEQDRKALLEDIGTICDGMKDWSCFANPFVTDPVYIDTWEPIAK